MKLFGHILLIIGVSGFLAGVVNLVHPERIPWVQDWDNYIESKALREGIGVIPLSVAFALYEEGGHRFVDARLASDFSESHIPGAVSLHFADLDRQFDVLGPLLESAVPLVVYCTNRECDDALLLALELRAMGQSNLLYYVDGFEVWEEMECPVASD